MKRSNINNEVNGFMQQIQSKNPGLAQTHMIKKAWFHIVDEQTAQHTDGVFIVPNTNCSEVIIYMDSAIWAAQQSMKTEVLRIDFNVKLAEMNTNVDVFKKDKEISAHSEQLEIIKTLKIMVSKRSYNRLDKKNKTKTFDAFEEKKENVQPVSLSAEEKAIILEAAKSIKDEDLRKQAIKAAVTQLEWNKARGK